MIFKKMNIELAVRDLYQRRPRLRFCVQQATRGIVAECGTRVVRTARVGLSGDKIVPNKRPDFETFPAEKKRNCRRAETLT
jgi:hypothetical protein